MLLFDVAREGFFGHVQLFDDPLGVGRHGQFGDLPEAWVVANCAHSRAAGE